MPEAVDLVVLTTGRQDYGILRSTLLALEEAPDFSVRIWAGGMHLQERFGCSKNLIVADGLSIAKELPFLTEPPDPVTAAAAAVATVGDALRHNPPAAMVVLGDRSEVLAAALAGTLTGVPIVHFHGGEETEGAIDNAMRHALTKLSHLHLVSHELHAQRVIQMGENPECVRVVGAAGLDNAHRNDLLDIRDLECTLSMPLTPPVVLVTVHPTTLADGGELAEVTAVAAAMAEVEATYVVTQPNADSGGVAIREFWLRWAENRDATLVLDALGEKVYWSLLRVVSAVLGNSSSGIIEAPSVGVPAVNVGDRQKGRLRHPGGIDVPAQPAAIVEALRRAIDPGARRALAAHVPPYPAGPVAPRVLDALREWQIPEPPRKSFVSRDLC